MGKVSALEAVAGLGGGIPCTGLGDPRHRNGERLLGRLKDSALPLCSVVLGSQSLGCLICKLGVLIRAQSQPPGEVGAWLPQAQEALGGGAAYLGPARW